MGIDHLLMELLHAISLAHGHLSPLTIRERSCFTYFATPGGYFGRTPPYGIKDYEIQAKLDSRPAEQIGHF